MFISCKSSVNSRGEKIETAVTILPYAGIVKEIGGEKVNVTVLVPPQSACETYEPSPIDIAKTTNSEIYFAVGAGYAFEKNLLKTIKENYKSLAVVDCSEGSIIKENNPHLWLSIEGVKKIAGLVCSSLIKARPGLEQYFTLNKEKFFTRADSINSIIENNLKQIKNRKIMVFHPSWLYFAVQYNLEQIAVEREGKEPTARDLRNIVNTGKKFNIKTLFLEPNTAEESAEALKEELKAGAVLLNPMEEDVLENLLFVSQKIKESLN